MSNYVCIHGHFYQPPRENPFTGEVPEQPSAAPWHDWNARITEESYAANARARILDGKGEVAKTINTYERISFDFGPTLLSWLAEGDPDTYHAVIAADAASADRFGGHGSAMAQAYNHTILPLSNHRDKVTQVKWGIADFEHRFGRRPEGMWLPETAVDMESLDILAGEGIRFTVLSPYQAAGVETDGGWADATDGSIDTRNPYLVDLGGDRNVAVFFYDGPLSREIAFDGLLEDGNALAARLLGSIGEPGEDDRLAHVATDGETYGHHHRHGEMALAVALEQIESSPSATLTNYAQYLADHPPLRRVAIAEDTSWSCAHGVERWRADCGCKTGREPTGHQRWREPLRSALDWLRDELIGPFESLGGALMVDPWQARDEYISVLLGDRTEADFLDTHGRPGIDAKGRRRAIGLLEVQEHAMLMYTSCGWFFDDISGLEAVFVLRHAGWACQLAREFIGVDLEPELMARLERAPSNLEGVTGRVVYEREVSPFVGRR